MILTADEIRVLTGNRRPTYQARTLDFMRIPYRRRPDGSLVVLRAHVEAPAPAATIRQEPRLRLPA